MSRRETLHLSQQSTFDLIKRAFPSGYTEKEYFALLKIFENTDVSRRALSQVLEAIDERPYSQHYYNFVHEVPARRIDPAILATVRDILEAAGFEQWLREED